MSNLLSVNDGFADATSALQELLDRGGEIELPQGHYRVTATLKIHGRTQLCAHRNARVFLCGETPKAAHDCLLTAEAGSEEIRVCGGVWNGNNQGRLNVKGDLRDLTAYSGMALNFRGVRGLVLEHMIVANPVAYYIRMAEIEDFRISDIGFLSDVPSSNQDGLHFGGGCRNGVVRDISALSKGQTGDDLIAFNADDSLARVENVGMVCGDIENILVENVFAEACHTVLRLLSVRSAIRNVVVRNVLAGYRCYAVNMDAARYCRTPLFEDADHPRGVGHIENVRIEGMTCHSSADFPAVCLETNADGLEIRDFRLRKTADNRPAQALLARNIAPCEIVADGKSHALSGKDDRLTLERFENLSVRAR